MKRASASWWNRLRTWIKPAVALRSSHVISARKPPPIEPRSSGDTLLERFHQEGQWDPSEGTRRLDRFFNELSTKDIHRLAFEHTADGHNLGTLAVDQAGCSWAQDYGRIPGVKTRFNHLCFLVQQGLDPNAPDAQGRIATVRAFANATRHLTVKDLDWAFTRGADFLAVETIHTMQAHSVLSIDLSDSPQARLLVLALQAHVVATLEALEPAARTQALTALQVAPVDAAHMEFWRELIHTHFEQKLSPARLLALVFRRASPYNGFYNCYHQGMLFSFPKFIQACLRAKPVEAWDGLELTPMCRELVHVEFDAWKSQVLATEGRHNLATRLAFEGQQGWASTKTNGLRVLAELGANINQHDASGRLAGLEGVANCTRPLTMEDLDYATDLGWNVLAVETGKRSILSIDMSMNYLYRDMVRGIQSLVEEHLATLETQSRKIAMDAISSTPLLPEHMHFWSSLRASYFDLSLPDCATVSGVSAPKVRF